MPIESNKKEDGTIEEVLSSTLYLVRLDGDILTHATLSGKLRKNFVKLFPGNRVQVEVSPSNQSRDLIILRY